MRHFIRYLATAILVLAQPTQATQNNVIERLVEQTVTAKLASRYANGAYSVSVQPVTATTQLRPCDQFVANIRSQKLHGRIPVHVRCQSPMPWALYATAIVNIKVPVLVTRRAIARGERILPDHLEERLVDLHQLRGQTVSNLEDVAYKVARHAIAAHQPLKLSQLSTPLAVAKGQRVHIEANSGRVTIQAYGVALDGGKIGDQIQVRNESSNRVIQPWILGPGKVATTPPSVLSHK